jgi:hypothetical protein
MNKQERAGSIVQRVLSLDAKFGKTIEPRSGNSTSRTRLISDDPRWEARVSFAYEKGPSGEPWDLVELFVYGQPKMTAAVHRNGINLRYYIPGPWEPIFLFFDPGDTTPLKPQ